MCAGECYNPSSERYLINRIEVIKITPQEFQGEPIEPLIQDNWKVIECPRSTSGCIVEFEDPEYSRDSTYYVRAIQEGTLAINGENITLDESGDASICKGSYKTDLTDDCLSISKRRAWSSPIYLRKP